VLKNTGGAFLVCLSPKKRPKNADGGRYRWFQAVPRLPFAPGGPLGQTRCRKRAGTSVPVSEGHRRERRVRTHTHIPVTKRRCWPVPVVPGRPSPPICTWGSPGADAMPKTGWNLGTGERCHRRGRTYKLPFRKKNLSGHRREGLGL
jgi:hypothetical protein